jgi:hypothetical protein
VLKPANKRAAAVLSRTFSLTAAVLSCYSIAMVEQLADLHEVHKLHRLLSTGGR